MIIERLVLHDFGIYRGRHEIDLSPTSADKPIVLVGALNGRGKTTMLDAVNLVLFGQRARLSNRKPNMAWDKYLKESINRKATGGALVGMTFTVEDDFETRSYDITRSWEMSGKSVKEFFNVSLNGVSDRVLADDWDSHVEGILPVEVASLNFFDGEKIDRLADPANSRQVIDSAIRGLLGLGVLEKLEADLKLFLKRKQEEAIGEQGSAEMAGIESEIATLEERRSQLTLDAAELKSQLDRGLEVVRRLEDRARAMGADKWEMRAALEAQSRELGAERAGAEAELHHVAEGVAPLALVTDLLKRTQDQAKTDDSIHRSRLLLDELRRRDEAILAQLSGDAARQVGEIFERDHALRQEVASAGTIHDAQGSTQTLTEAAIRDVESLGGLGEVLERIGVLDVRINEVDRELLAVPTEGQLGPILEELGRERSLCDQLQQQHQSAIQEIEHISSTLSRQNMTLDRVRTAEADRQKDGLEDRRSREYAQKALESVGRLISTTVERNLNNIEAAILQRFHQLIGKKKLITAIIIDKETLEMRVATGDNEDLPIERLSAGERQLLATAAIWGLSTVAGRSIPLVVDTPLGRLDGDHRINLATNYFPNAAGQVIILSTDSEFTPDLYEQMRHAVGREYTLRFREENESSEIVPGYFLEVENAH